MTSIIDNQPVFFKVKVFGIPDSEPEFSILDFEVTGGVLSPEDLFVVHLPNLDRRKGVVISGRGPIWLYGYLVHECHPHPWVGLFDPRLGGAVVVETHVKDVNVGQVIPIPDGVA